MIIFNIARVHRCSVLTACIISTGNKDFLEAGGPDVPMYYPSKRARNLKLLFKGSGGFRGRPSRPSAKAGPTTHS